MHQDRRADIQKTIDAVERDGISHHVPAEPKAQFINIPASASRKQRREFARKNANVLAPTLDGLTRKVAELETENESLKRELDVARGASSSS